MNLNNGVDTNSEYEKIRNARDTILQLIQRSIEQKRESLYGFRPDLSGNYDPARDEIKNERDALLNLYAIFNISDESALSFAALDDYLVRSCNQAQHVMFAKEFLNQILNLIEKQFGLQIKLSGEESPSYREFLEVQAAIHNVPSAKIRKAVSYEDYMNLKITVLFDQLHTHLRRMGIWN